MNSRSVMVLPGGTVVRHYDKDAEVKALAVRLGVYAQITAGMRKEAHLPRPASAVLCRDGNTLFAVVALSGWDDPKDNGWAALAATPAGNEGAVFLERFVRTVITGTGQPRFEEKDQPWPN